MPDRTILSAVRSRGYEAAECVVKREVGALLKSIQEELALQNLSLKMFDCYRPARAVADMVAWSRDGKETPAEKRFNPAFSKPDLFRLGYIADHSGHSTGAALDLTLVDLKADNSAAFDPTKDYGDCTRPRTLARRKAASTWAPATTVPTSSRIPRRAPSRRPSAAGGRSWSLLMARQGFVNYSKEWWHFSLPGAGGQAYDFPITPRN